MYSNWSNNIGELNNLEPLSQMGASLLHFQFYVKCFFGQNWHVTRRKYAVCWWWDFSVRLWMEMSTHLHVALHQDSVRSRVQQTISESFQTRHAGFQASSFSRECKFVSLSRILHLNPQPLAQWSVSALIDPTRRKKKKEYKRAKKRWSWEGVHL